MQKIECMKMKDERGIALVLVLWVLMLLFIIVFEFCSTMRIEATITKNFKEGERSYYFAQAGINRAIIELVKTKSEVKKFKGGKETLVDKEDRRESNADEEEEPEEWLPREQPYTFIFEDGECEVTIGDEGSKINLNWVATKAQSDRQVLADILERSCGLYDVERDTIVDSIIDWVDKDHERLMNGAEDDYYESLEEPYECRDGEFVILEELLLVRGVTEDIYYGRFKPEDDAEEKKAGSAGRRRGRSSFATRVSEDDEMPAGMYQGLSKIFTVFSKSTSLKLNINDAPFGLLMSLPEMTEDVAYDIIAMRREEEFEDVRDSRLLELPIYDQIASYITVEPTNFYRITARGRVADSTVARSISAVVEIAPRQKDNYTILYWQEGV